MDLNDAKTLVEVAIAPVLGAVWYMLRRNSDQTQRTADALAAHELYAAQTFATKVELTGSMQRVERGLEAMYAKLERIDDKLDRKADKP